MLFNEKSKSKSQQRLFGLIHQCQKTGKCVSKEVEKVAGTIKFKDAKDFAKTKHKGLPEKVKKKSFKEWFHQNSQENYMKCTCSCKSCKNDDCSKCSCKDCKCQNCKCNC